MALDTSKMKHVGAMLRPGDRIKTDRRDARKLATLYRAGELTVVHPPTGAQESVRDLVRGRESAREDLLRGRPHGKAIAAVARELVGFIWAVLYEGQAGQAAKGARRAAARRQAA